MDDVFFGLIDPQLTAAGCVGGLFHAFCAEKVTPWEVIRSIVVGGIAANFIAPEVFRVVTMFPLKFLGFVIGMCGQYSCYRLETYFKSIDVFGRTKNE